MAKFCTSRYTVVFLKLKYLTTSMIEPICVYLMYMYGTAHTSIPVWASHMGVVLPHTHMSCPYVICQLCCYYFLFQCFFCLDSYFILTICTDLFRFCHCIQLYTCHFSIAALSQLQAYQWVRLLQYSHTNKWYM